MKIDRIYISGYRGDQRYTRCCVASVRRWYPDIPITLIKDTLAGDYDTSDLERYWQVSLLQGERKRFGPAGKLEPLFLPTGERFLVMDSDVVFLGRVLDALEDFDEDVVVNGWDGVEDVEAYYFSVEQLRRVDPNFLLHERAFAAGNYVARSALISREDFSAFIAWTEPPRLLRHDVFRNVDQGPLNYVLLRKFQDGAITMRWHNFMWWSGEPTLRIDARRLHDGDAYPYMLHWAGPKRPLFRQMPQQLVLDTYERLYYARIPNGRLRRDRIVANETWRLMARRLHRKLQPSNLRALQLATSQGQPGLLGQTRRCSRKVPGSIRRRLSGRSGYSGGGT